MSKVRYFFDTAFVLGLLNPQDQCHRAAASWFPRMRKADEVWTTEAVLVEIGNGLAARYRSQAIAFIEQCYRLNNIHVAPVSSDLLLQAFEVYKEREDKTWGLTDCISFQVMTDQGLSDALTVDEHFVQAGFRALLLEP